MALTEQQLELLQDAAISTDARVLGLWLSDNAIDWLEVDIEQFNDLLSADATKDRRQRALAQLERRGWAERRPGGRGHSDCFRFSGRKTRQLSATLPEIQAAESGTYPDSSRESRQVSTDSSRDIRQLNDPGGGYRGGREENEGGGEQHPPTPHLESAAIEAMSRHGEVLAGCRGSLRDYLLSRVSPGSQSAYVHAVVCYLNDQQPVFRYPDGSRIPTELRRGLLATALNELGAQDEQRMKSPVGDVRNLKTKIDIVIRQAWEAENEPGGSGSGSGSSSRRTRGGDRGGTAAEAGGASTGAGDSLRPTGTEGRRGGFVIE